MEKFLLNPKASGAFSSEVMHNVVLNGIDFELPDNIWDAIDDAFGNYWNIEVGYGGWPDFNSAVRSISNWLLKEHIIFSLDKIATIVNVMFDWIELFQFVGDIHEIRHGIIKVIDWYDR